MAGHRIVEFARYKICVNDDVYEPAEDSELVLNILSVKKGEKGVDIGSGTGILGLHALYRGASNVIFIDINPFAVETTLCTIKINGMERYADVINCDLLSCINRERSFDFAIFNPPYLPFEEYDKWIGYSWSGGKSGAEVIIKFLEEINAKRIYFVYSSLTDEDKVLMKLSERHYEIRVKKDIVIGYEDIIAVEAVKK